MVYFKTVISIFLLITLQQIAIDIYLPSFPDMANYFSVSSNVIQYSLSFYLLGFGISPLFFGPLSDGLGRRKILILSMFLYLLATFICAITNSILTLLIFRMVQGIASGGLQVSTSAIARDIAQGNKLIVLSSYMSLIWSAVPMIAPAVGGYIQAYLGWRANFYFIVIYSVPVIYFVYRYLPETHVQRAKLSLKCSMQRFWTLLFNKQFIFYVIATALSFSLTIAFCTAAPFLFQTHLGLSEIQFGWLMFGVSGSYMLGAFLNSLLVKRYSVQRIMQGGQLFMLISALLMALFALMGIFTVLSVAAPAFMIIFGQGFVFPNALGLALDGIKKHFALSTSLFSSFQMIAVSLVSQLVASFSNVNQLPLALIMLGLVILLGILYYIVIVPELDKKK